MKRRPVTLSEDSDASHTMGAAMRAGGSNLFPVPTGSAMRVAVAPPGISTFAVTPVSRRDFARAATNASPNALDIPYAARAGSSIVSRLVLMKTILPHPRLIVPGTTNCVSRIGAKVLISMLLRLRVSVLFFRYENWLAIGVLAVSNQSHRLVACRSSHAMVASGSASVVRR
jgi:hypothetical protein